MVKKIISVVLVSVFLSLTLSGCADFVKSMFSYWDGMTIGETKSYVQEALKEKYGEEFIINYVNKRSGEHYTELVGECSPKSDEDIVFRIKANHFSDDRMLYDEYIRNVVRKQMKSNIEDVLAKYYNEYAAEVNVLGLDPYYDSGICSSEGDIIKTFSESFSKNNKEDSNKTNVWIVVKENEQSDINKIQNALQEMTDIFYSLKVYIDCFFADQATIDLCNEKANSLNTSHFEVMDITYNSNFTRERFVYYNNGNGLVHITSDIDD